MMDVAGWVRDLPPERISALKPVYKEMKKAYLHDSIDGLERFHQKKVEKLQYHQRLYDEHNENANHWFETANKLLILKTNQESVDSAKQQAQKETEYASYHLKLVNALWDQVGMLTEVIDHYQKTSVLKAWFVISGQPDDDDEFVEYFAERFYHVLKKDADSMAVGKVFSSEHGEVDQQIPDWMIKSRNDYFNEFWRRVDESKKFGIKKTHEAIYHEMMDEMQVQGVMPPYTTYESFNTKKKTTFKRKG